MKELTTFKVTIGGHTFEVYRKCTALTAKLGGVRQVLGALQAVHADEAEADKLADAYEQYSELLRRFTELAVVSVDGVPVEDSGHTWDELQFVADVLFKEYMKSGLSVDPSPGSLTGPKEPS